jgi:hypothetical protein
MDLDVFSAGFFDKKVGIDVRTCISYIKLEPFLRFGPVSRVAKTKTASVPVTCTGITGGSISLFN